jgi:acyl-CoA thioester hydrolase
LSPLSSECWFDYPVIVQPHHTDYAGVVWHGTYVAWMEEARIAALEQAGVGYADLVSMGCDLPVIDLSLSYRKALQMGDRVRVRTRLEGFEKVRFRWIQNICASDTDLCFVTGRVTLVAVGRESHRILRRLPPLVQNAVARLTSH